MALSISDFYLIGKQMYLEGRAGPDLLYPKLSIKLVDLYLSITTLNTQLRIDFTGLEVGMVTSLLILQHRPHQFM